MIFDLMLFLARKQQTSWVANFDFPCYKSMLLFALTLKEEYTWTMIQGHCVLNVTYIWKFKPLICVLWCFL